MAMNSEFLMKLRVVMEGDAATKAKLRSLKSEVSNVPGVQAATGAQIRKAADEAGLLAGQAGKAKNAFTEMGHVMGKAMIVAPTWIILRAAIMGVMNALQALPQAAIAWEKEMAQIKRVGKGTEGEYALLSSRLLDLARTYGIASESIGVGSALWAQQGKTMSEIVPLMETTIKLSLITGKSVSASVEDITAIMKSYKVEAQDTMSILDKLIKVEQEHAITTEVLTDAMKTGGPVAAEYGVSFEKFLGIITATHVATRASGNQIGNAWKTIFARMSTDAIPAIQNMAKVPVYMDAAGKATYNNTGTFREWGNVLDEVMVSMQSLSEVERTSLLSSLAMKRTINYLLSAYQNWDEGIKATIESLDSTGSANQALGIILGTTDAKAKQLQSAWAQLGVTFIDNGQIIKDTLSGLETLVVGLNRLALATKGAQGREIIASQAYTANIQAEIAANDKKLGKIKAIEELQKQLSQTQSFAARITADTTLVPERKQHTLAVIEKNRQLIQDTLDRQPPLEDKVSVVADSMWLQDLGKIRDEATTLFLSIPKNALPFALGEPSVGEMSFPQLEKKIADIKKQNIDVPLSVTAQKQADVAVNTLEKIVELKKKERNMATAPVIDRYTEMAQNKQELDKVTKEYAEDETKITMEQEKQLKMEKELMYFSVQRGVTDEQILQKKLQLLEAEQAINASAKNGYAIEQTKNQILQSQLNKRKQEEDLLASLSMQYEKADMFKKGDIRRVAELATQTPENLAYTSTYNTRDKELIQENLSLFTAEQQAAVVKTTQLWKDLSGFLTTIPINPDILSKTKVEPQLAAQLTQNVIGAQKIDIIINGKQMSAEEIAAIISREVANNVEFRKAIADAAANTNIPKK